MENKKNIPEKKEKAPIPLFFVWQSFIVILIAVALFATGIAFNTINQLKNNITQRHKLFEEQITQSVQTNTLEVQQLKQLSEKVGKIQEKLDPLVREKHHPKEIWLLDETQHLLRLANINLRYNHNIDTAKNLLQTAIEQLPQTSDAVMANLRQQLSNKITLLEKIPKIDKNALVSKLTFLIRQINSIPIINQTPVEKQEKTDKPETTASWKTPLQSTWTALQKIIVIRHVSQTTPLFLLPTQRFVFNQTIQLSLEQAQWAILQSDAFLYKTSLEQAKTLIKNYADTSKQLTKNFIDTLEQLQKVNLLIKAPDLNDSINLLNSIIEKHQGINS